MRKGAKLFLCFRCLCGQIRCYKLNYRENRGKALRPQRDFFAIIIPKLIGYHEVFMNSFEKRKTDE